MPSNHDLSSIAATLGGQIVGRDSVLVPGPGHSRKDRSLKVKFKPDGAFTVTSYSGDDWKLCKDYVRQRLGLFSDWRREPTNDNKPVIRLRDRDDDEPARIRSAILRWETAVPVGGSLAERYLASRGLYYSGEAIRYRPNDRTMVSFMTDAITAEPCGVHCTYLDSEGRKLDRKMFGRAGGAVVRLSLDEDVEYGLGVGEGIETCLATGFTPIWAALSAGTLAAFPLLNGVDCLTIFADHDYAGMTAANDCGRRWHRAGNEVEIIAPFEIGADFADKSEAA